MSVITNLMLYVSHGWGRDGLRIVELTDYFELKWQHAFVSIHDETLPSLWYGGHRKGFEAEVYIGVYNHLNLEAFVRHLQGLEWRSRTVQLFVREQEDSGFRIITIRTDSGAQALKGTRLRVECSRALPEKRAVFALGQVTDGFVWDDCFFVVESAAAGDRWYVARASVRAPGETEEVFAQAAGVEALVFYPAGAVREIGDGEEFVGVEEPADWQTDIRLSPVGPPELVSRQAPPDEHAPSADAYRIEHLPQAREFGQAWGERRWTLRQVLEHCLRDWDRYPIGPCCRVIAQGLAGSVVWTVREEYWSEQQLAEGADGLHDRPLLRFILGWKIERLEPDEVEGINYIFTPYSERGASNWLGFRCPLGFLDLVPAPNDPQARQWRRRVVAYWRDHPDGAFQEEDLVLLNCGLDELEAALGRLENAVRDAREAIDGSSTL